MNLRLILMLAILSTLCAGSGLAGELSNRGAYNEFFNDSASGLTWCDPGLLGDADRAEIDAFVTINAAGWVWATSAQIDALVGSVAAAGYDLEGIMGDAQFYVGGGGPRWISYHAGLSPDGWLIESDADPFVVLSASGGQANAAAWSPGAWLVNATDPATMARLQNAGDLDEFFSDPNTGLNWCDPEMFVGMDRQQVADWLVANPMWRWATAAEVSALVGRMSAGDTHLAGILGEPQFMAGASDPRWIGYYELATQPDGLAIQAGLAPHYHVVTIFGTQTNVATWSPGAWVVTTQEPQPVTKASWGEVKAGYR